LARLKRFELLTPRFVVGNYRRELEKRATDFAEAWRELDSVQRREFVTTHREELRQASYLGKWGVEIPHPIFR